MARKRMVTRTVKTYKVNALTMTQCGGAIEPRICYVSAANCKGTPEKVLDYLRKNYEYGGISIIRVNSIEPQSVRYGMPEDDFINVAEILDDDAQDEKESEVE